MGGDAGEEGTGARSGLRAKEAPGEAGRGASLTRTGAGRRPGQPRGDPYHHLGGIRLQSRPPAESGKGESPGLSGDWEGIPGPPTRKFGPPRALEIPRAPRNAARLPGNQEKNFCFFFLFWHSRSPRALLLALAPTWGAPARGPAPSPPPTNRLCEFVTGGADDRRGHAPCFSVYKRQRRRPRAQIAETLGRLFPCAAAWITLAEDFAIFFPAFSGEEFAAFRRSRTSAPAPWEGFGLSGLGVCVFSSDTVAEGLSTVDYNCNMTLEELVACDNAAQK